MPVNAVTALGALEIRAPQPAPRTTGTALASYLTPQFLNEDPTPRWASPGVQFPPFGCASLSGRATEDECVYGEPDKVANLTFPGASNCEVFRPFKIEVVMDFTTLQWVTQDLTEFVQAHTALWRSAIIAREVLNAALTPNESFFSSAANLGAAGTPLQALARVEDGLAARLGNGVGMIHVTPGMYNLLVASGAVEDFRTAVGTTVVVDAGYNGGQPPTGVVAANSGWIYGSGPVLLQTADLTANGRPLVALKMSDNTAMIDVEQYAVVAFDPCTVVAASGTTAS